MIELIKPYDGNDVGTTFPLMPRGAARLLVKRGFAKFIDPRDLAEMEAADDLHAQATVAKAKRLAELTAKQTEPVKDDANETEPEKLAPKNTADSPAGERRGRKKAT